MKDTGGDKANSERVQAIFLKTMCRFVQWVLLKVNSQRFYKNALLSGLLPCLFLCVAVPWDLLSVCVTFSFAEPQCPHNEIGRCVDAGL